MQKERRAHDNCRACIEIASQRLTEGVLSPFNSISELQHLASFLSRCEPRPAIVTLSEDVQTIYVNGIGLHMERWRSGLRHIAEDIEKRFSKVFRGLDRKYTIPKDLKDNMNDTTMGVSWLDAARFTETVNPLLKHYLDDPECHIAYIGPDGHFYFHPGPAMEFMEDCSYINSRLCMLNAQANSQNTRATAHIDTRIRNGHRRRNHYQDAGQLRCAIQQSKNSHNRNMDVFIPILIAPEIQVMEETYLIFLRPVEEAIALSLWGNSSRMLYREFLYVQMGLRVSPEMWYKQFPTNFRLYFEVSYGVREYRHWSVCVMREFIEQIYYIHQAGSSVGDKVADHSTTQSRGTYAIIADNLAYATTDFTWLCDQFNRRWQELSGFSTTAPPLPIKILNRMAVALKTSRSMTVATASSIYNPAVDGSNDLPMAAYERSGSIEMMIMQMKADQNLALEALRIQINGDMRIAIAEALSSSGHNNSKAVIATSPFSNQAVPVVLTRDVLLHAPQPAARAEGSARGNPIPDVPSPMEDVVGEEEWPAELEATAKSQLRSILHDPKADWKSEEQRKTVMYSLQPAKHLVSAMATGGGKSMSWIICSLLQTAVTVVIVPFHTLLLQHLNNARQAGCKAMQWTSDMASIGQNNLIFMAMETAGSKAMQRLV
jgi:hypothetical protein